MSSIHSIFLKNGRGDDVSFVVKLKKVEFSGKPLKIVGSLV